MIQVSGGENTPPTNSNIGNLSLIFNTIPRTGMNYIGFVCIYSLNASKYNMRSFEQIHSPSFASVTPPNSIQFFIKRDPIDAIQSAIYSNIPDNLSEKELIEKLDNRQGENTKDWILHLSNVKKNKNIEVISFDDFTKDTFSYVQNIQNKTGLPFNATKKTIDEAVEQLSIDWKKKDTTMNFMPIEKKPHNSLIKKYIVSNDLYGRKDTIYDLYNSIEPTIVL